MRTQRDIIVHRDGQDHPTWWFWKSISPNQNFMIYVEYDEMRQYMMILYNKVRIFCVQIQNKFKWQAVI